MTPRVRRLPANDRGRDFVIGDLHGCLGDLQEKLRAARFDPAAGDRLFSVGDLVDRGPDSLGCLALLRQPLFHAVLGNHEQMMLDAMAEGVGDQSQAFLFHVFNGGGWAVDLIRSRAPHFLALAERVVVLPHVLVVGEGPCRFHVVHAQLLASLETGRQYLDRDIDSGNWGDEPNAAVRLTWSRVLANDGAWAGLDGVAASYWPGLSLTYCGHNPVPRPAIVQSHYFVDTGAGYPGNVWVESFDSGLPMRLTMLERLPDGGHRVW